MFLYKLSNIHIVVKDVCLIYTSSFNSHLYGTLIDSI